MKITKENLKNEIEKEIKKLTPELGRENELNDEHTQEALIRGIYQYLTTKDNELSTTLYKLITVAVYDNADFASGTHLLINLIVLRFDFFKKFKIEVVD